MLRMTRPHTWTNWARTYSFTPNDVLAPASTTEVVEIIDMARQANVRVKAVGSGHSFTPIAQTDGILVNPRELRGVISVDLEHMQVRVKAGTPLHELNEILASHGLAMENLGDIDRQTISGAISTGTHGTGARFKGLAQSVIALQIVTADSVVHECSLDSNSSLFNAARIGLGAMGVITEYTLQCVPAFLLHAIEEPGSLSDTMASLDELVDSHDHVEFYWFPHTDRVLLKRNTRLPSHEPAHPLSTFRAWLDDDFLSNTVFEGVNRVGSWRPSWFPAINQLTSRVLSAREYSTQSHAVFASPRRVKFREMEYALPRAAAITALTELNAMIERQRLTISFPVEVRFAAADDLWLSTAQGRDTCYIAIHQYHRIPYQPYFREFEAIAQSMQGRPHWGKLHSRNRSNLEPVYPYLTDAVQVRDRVDPQRMFGNQYLEQVFGDEVTEN